MIRRLLVICGVLAGLLRASVASAQTQVVQSDSPQWLKDRRYSEGAGFRTGDVELHLSLAGEFGYDSNWFLRSDRSNVDNGPPNAPVVPSLEFRLTPSFYVSTLGPQRREGDAREAMPDVAFRAGVNATYREFICLGDNCTGSNDISQQRSVSVGAETGLVIMPERPVNFAINAAYSRIVQPNLTTADPNLSFTNDAIDANGELGLESGTLDWHFGYRLRAVFYEETAGQGFNSLNHQIYTRGRWRYWPRTAFVYDGSIAFDNYTNNGLAAEQGLVNSMPVRSRIGLNGLVTDRFGLLAMAGWAASFNETTTAIAHIPQFDGPIGQAELRWYLAANPGTSALGELGLALSSIALGYTHDFSTSLLGEFYTLDRGYLRFNYFFAGRVAVALEGGVGAVTYPTMYWQDDTFRHAGFTDVRADATLFGEYRMTSFLGVNATVRYTTNISNTHDVPDIEGMPGSVFDMAWNRLEAFIGVRAFW